MEIYWKLCVTIISADILLPTLKQLYLHVAYIIHISLYIIYYSLMGEEFDIPKGLAPYLPAGSATTAKEMGYVIT